MTKWQSSNLYNVLIYSYFVNFATSKYFVNCRRIESDNINIGFISWVYATIYVVILDFSPYITLRRSKQYTNDFKF